MPGANGEAGQEGGEAGAGGEGGGQDHLFEVVLDGETVKVGMEDAKNGYLRHSDYTKKTQALSEREKRIDKHIEDRATELYLQSQAEARKGGEGGEGGAGEAGGEGGEGGQNFEGSERERQLTERLNKLEQSTQAAEQERSNQETDAEIAGIMKGLKEKYPLANEKLVKLRVHEELGDHDDVEEVFDRIAKEEHEGRRKHDLDTINRYIETKQMPHASGEAGSSVSGAGGKTPKPPQDFREARKAANERLRQAGRF